jgi:hypothetical protein
VSQSFAILSTKSMGLGKMSLAHMPSREERRPETACGPVGILPKPTGFMGKIAIMGLGPGAVSQPKPTLLYFR